MRSFSFRALFGLGGPRLQKHPVSAWNQIGSALRMRRKNCAPLSVIDDPPAPELSPPRRPKCHRVELSVSHLVEVNAATRCLMEQLGCDDWFVACRSEHLVVVRLLRGGVSHYAVSFRCTPSVEKAIYHGSRAWGISVIPLCAEDELRGDQVSRAKSALAGIGVA
jgi:hypothetical protein